MKTASGEYEPPLIANLNNKDADHDELRADVDRLLKLPPIPEKAHEIGMTRAEYWLQAILRKIEHFQFNHIRRTMVPISKYHQRWWDPGRRHNHLRIGKEWFMVADMPDITAANDAERKRQTLYWVLDQALKSGEFTNLKRCRNPRCPRPFYISARRNIGCCSAKCNQSFYNQKYQAKGVFMDNYRKKRNERFEKAEEYKQQGWNAEQIAKETHLTVRALIRKGFFDEYEV